MKKFTKARRRKFSEPGPRTRTELRVQLRREFVQPVHLIQTEIVLPQVTTTHRLTIGDAR